MSTFEEFVITRNKLKAVLNEKALLDSEEKAVLMRQSALKDMKDENVKKVKDLTMSLGVISYNLKGSFTFDAAPVFGAGQNAASVFGQSPVCFPLSLTGSGVKRARGETKK